VGKYCVKHLAEEYSTQALEEQGISETTVETLASHLGIAHSYCDLDRDTRHSLGIPHESEIRMKGFCKGWTEEEISHRIRQFHRARERFWLERLLVTGLWPVLFVCGADHATHFADLLRSKGFDASVIEEQWSAPGSR
jgi:hypothetical protein